MSTLFWIILTTTAISLFSLIGVFTLAIKEKILEKILLYLLALSAGALMGGAFLHLLPESMEKFENSDFFILVLFAFVFFFLVEKVLHWRHCHKTGKCDIHTFGYMNLFGDSIHNFIDGLIIAATFIADIHLGVITVVAIILHEIPQEIGDFGVLIYAGFEKKKALLVNLIVGIIAVLGGIVGYYVSRYINSSMMFLLPFAAGGFIYIAASDLLPELRKEKNIKKSMLSLMVFIVGIIIMYLMKYIEVE